MKNLGIIVVAFALLGGCDSCGKSRASAEGGAAASSAPACGEGLVRAPHDGWKAVALAGSAACALHSTGRVACWGDSAVGNGTAWLPCDEPAWVDGLADVASISGGGGSAMCVRTTKKEA